LTPYAAEGVNFSPQAALFPHFAISETMEDISRQDLKLDG